MGIKWSDKVSNDDLYKITNTTPISKKINKSRLRLLGHILRRNANIPANAAMTEYFKPGPKKYPGRRPSSLPNTIREVYEGANYPGTHKDHNYCKGPQLRSTADLERTRKEAQDRGKWQLLYTDFDPDTTDPPTC